jgi:glycosyltransferase involved in cell wall biosynthesis
VVKSYGANLLHLHTFASHVLGARLALACGIAAVRTEHGIRHYSDPSCAINRHWALRQTARIVAVSKFVGDVVATIAPDLKSRIQVVQNGVDTDYFRPQPAKAGTSLTALVLSRLEREKRVEMAILALRLAPNIRLRIAGEGSRRAALATLAERMGLSNRVEFLGYRADPRPMIADSDVLLNCTRYEGLGLAVLEAASMQRPAIAFDGGGIPEVIDDGRSGWLVRNDSPEGLADALNEVAHDRDALQRCGIEARNRVEKVFTVEAMCKKYAAVYRELIDGAGRAN